MSTCARPHSCNKSLSLGVPSLAVRWLTAMVLVLGALAWPLGEGLRAQEKLPANAPVQESAPSPQAPPLQPATAPQPVPPSAQPSPSSPQQLIEFQVQPAQFLGRSLRRFPFTIAPDAPLKDLLPPPPSVKKSHGPALRPNLADVPEVTFQAPLARDLSSDEALKQTAHLIAKANHLNAKETDAFLKALVGQRPDLAGLPFAMGDACRIQGERSRQLTRAVATVRGALQPMTSQVFAPPPSGFAPQSPPPPVPQGAGPPPTVAVPAQSGTPVVAAVPPTEVAFLQRVSEEPVTPGKFWDQYARACAQEDMQISPVDRAQQEHVLLARIAALMQVLAPETPALRLGLVKYLAATSHVEATRALARLAIFSEEDEVRQAAVVALKVRRERDYTDTLLESFRYPWPPVAQRGADALVKLERTDLVPQLVDVLDQPDPRAPVVKVVEDQRVHQVRELVRLNHHRSCLLCHAPGNTSTVSPDTLTAAVPTPSDPLPALSEGYQTTSPDVLVRVDVTYLRQDFSVLQPVADAHPWPEMQRFDFLVRTRELTEQEAADYRRKLTAAEPGRLSPYHRAALAALRELTGRDTAPTAEAWRRLLNLPIQ